MSTRVNGAHLKHSLDFLHLINLQKPETLALFFLLPSLVCMRKCISQDITFNSSVNVIEA